MGDTNDLMEFVSASLGATLDKIFQRLIDCDFAQEDPGPKMFVVALLNALGREGRGNRPLEVVLMLAFLEFGTAKRGRNRLMRWRRGEMSGHDLIQTSETIETLEKKENDQREQSAKLQEYRAIAREGGEWKNKFEDMHIAFKEEEMKHLKSYIWQG